MIKTKRIEFIDMAKCFAIFLVVWGHTASNQVLLGENAGIPMLYRAIYAVHMPLFFFLSGLSMKAKGPETGKEWKLFLRKNILCVLVPYLIWGLIYSNFSFSNLGRILFASYKQLGNAGTLTSLWYLACLFVARIIVAGILCLTGKTMPRVNQKKAVLLAALPCFAIGFLLPEIETGYPYCLNTAFVASGLMLSGIAAKDVLVCISHNRKILIPALLVSSGLFALGTIGQGEKLVIFVMARLSYGNLALTCANAITGGIVILSLSMLLSGMGKSRKAVAKNALIYVGQHTIGIYLLHKNLMQEIIIPILTNLLGSFLPNSLILFLSANFAVCICMFLCTIITHYVPAMMGVFPQELIAPTANAKEAD